MNDVEWDTLQKQLSAYIRRDAALRKQMLDALTASELANEPPVWPGTTKLEGIPITTTTTADNVAKGPSYPSALSEEIASLRARVAALEARDHDGALTPATYSVKDEEVNRPRCWKCGVFERPRIDPKDMGGWTQRCWACACFVTRPTDGSPER